LATCSLPLTSFEGGALMKKTLSCTSGLLAGGLLLLACTNSVLVEEPLAVGSLFLASASGLLNEECLILVRPQIVDGRLPIHVGAVRASVSPMKNGPSGCPRRQQSGSLLVFANGSLMPAFFVVKRSTNVGRGVVAFVVVEHPLRGAWGCSDPCDTLDAIGRSMTSRRILPSVRRCTEPSFIVLSNLAALCYMKNTF